MVALTQTSDSGALSPATPVTRTPLTAQQKDELFVYALRLPQAFQYARQRLQPDCFDKAGDTHYDALWRAAVRLADLHGNGSLPSNLRNMVEADVRAAAATEAPEPTLNPLLGRPTQMGRDDQRDGGLLDRVFGAAPEQIEGMESRARELVDRVADECGVARLLQDFVGQCGELVPTRDSIDAMLQHAQRQLEGQLVGGSRLQLIGSAEFSGREFRNEWLVENVLVAGQPALVGGMKKTLKTSIIVDLAVSLGIGQSVRFLNYFPVQQQVNVGVFSGESGAATLQESFRRVCAAKGCTPSDCAVHWCFNLPQLSSPSDLRLVSRQIRSLDLGAVIFDPIYLALLSGNTSASPANLFEVGPLLKAIADTCLEAGATPILVHHNTKPRGNSRIGNVPQLEDLAFAGFQEFARQWLLLGRREHYVPGTGEHRLWLNVGGSAGFSGCYGVDVNEGVVSSDFSGRQWRVHVQPESRQREADGRQRMSQLDERALAQRQRDETALMRVLQRVGDNGITLTGLRDSSGVKGRTAAILEDWVNNGTVVETQVQQRCGRGSRRYDGYCLNPDRCVPYPHATNGDETEATERSEDGTSGEDAVDFDHRYEATSASASAPRTPAPSNGQNGR